MHKIAITQRVDYHKPHAEYRDALDNRWHGLCDAIGAIAHPLPNIAPHHAAYYLDAIAPKLLILSGGNSLSAYDADAPDASRLRDAWEAALIDESCKRNIPILGICRGLQMINHHFGGVLRRLDGHVATRHPLTHDGRFPMEVNSYHAWGLLPHDLAENVTAIAHAQDNSVEAIAHRHLPIYGIMWHPEREAKTNPHDMDFIRSIIA